MSKSVSNHPLYGQDQFYLGVCLFIASIIISMFAPPLALVVAWIGVVISARNTYSLLKWHLVAFSHAGALIFASRSMLPGFSDFVNYYGVYTATCSSASTLDDTLFAFGVEIGLPVIFQMLSSIGLCGLSPHGLAWLLGFATSTALLLVIAKLVYNQTPFDERALVLGGLCLMFSFFFTTQLARQAISSIFVIRAIWIVRGFWRKLVFLALGSAFHVSVPIIWSLVWIFQRSSVLLSLLVLIPPLFFAIASFDTIVWFIQGHFSSIEQLGRLSEYVTLAAEAEGPSSDLQFFVLLSSAGLLLALRSWRSKHDVVMADNAKILTGLGLLALPLLSIPLATTRLMLPLAGFAIGAFLFRGLAAKSIRLFAWLLLYSLLIKRFVSFSLSDGLGDHVLWTAYPPMSWMPGYWIQSF